MQHKRHGVRPSLSTGEDRHALIVHEKARASQYLGTAGRHTEAARAQERDYLGAWLSSRVDARGRPLPDSALTAYASHQRQIARYVRLARSLHVDWMRPAAPLAFDVRLRQIAAAGRSSQASPHHTRGALALASDTPIGEGASYGY